MIDIKNKILEEPYLQFYDCYEAAVKANQFAVEAIAISSFNKNKNHSRIRNKVNHLHPLNVTLYL